MVLRLRKRCLYSSRTRTQYLGCDIARNFIAFKVTCCPKPNRNCSIKMSSCFLMIIILGSTSNAAYKKFAPIAIGLALTLIHLISISISNTSVNPARSTSQAIFAGGGYLNQLWIFWLVPIAASVLAGIIFRANKKCD